MSPSHIAVACCNRKKMTLILNSHCRVILFAFLILANNSFLYVHSKDVDDVCPIEQQSADCRNVAFILENCRKQQDVECINCVAGPYQACIALIKVLEKYHDDYNERQCFLTTPPDLNQCNAIAARCAVVSAKVTLFVSEANACLSGGGRGKGTGQGTGSTGSASSVP
eukprot:15333156-Ditylum_brightwellii.AAC.1